jgi:hypothetical protein
MLEAKYSNSPETHCRSQLAGEDFDKFASKLAPTG